MLVFTHPALQADSLGGLYTSTKAHLHFASPLPPAQVFAIHWFSPAKEEDTRLWAGPPAYLRMPSWKRGSLAPRDGSAQARIWNGNSPITLLPWEMCDAIPLSGWSSDFLPWTFIQVAWHRLRFSFEINFNNNWVLRMSQHSMGQLEKYLCWGENQGLEGKKQTRFSITVLHSPGMWISQSCLLVVFLICILILFI